MPLCDLLGQPISEEPPIFLIDEFEDDRLTSARLNFRSVHLTSEAAEIVDGKSMFDGCLNKLPSAACLFLQIRTLK